MSHRSAPRNAVDSECAAATARASKRASRSKRSASAGRRAGRPSPRSAVDGSLCMIVNLRRRHLQEARRSTIIRPTFRGPAGRSPGAFALRTRHWDHAWLAARLALKFADVTDPARFQRSRPPRTRPSTSRRRPFASGRRRRKDASSPSGPGAPTRWPPTTTACASSMARRRPPRAPAPERRQVSELREHCAELIAQRGAARNLKGRGRVS